MENTNDKIKKEAALSVIEQLFIPGTLTSFDFKLTTNQIIERIEDHCGQKLSASDLVQFLNSNGYVYASFSEMDIYWLFLNVL